MSRQRIERLLEARSLDAMPAGDEEVAGIWAAAIREWSDAAVPGLSVAGAFIHVYQAAFRAATAIVRAAGYRVRGAAGGHHYVTFHAVAAFGDAEMERLADTLQNVRGAATRRSMATRKSWSPKIWRPRVSSSRRCSTWPIDGCSLRGRRCGLVSPSHARQPR